MLQIEEGVKIEVDKDFFDCLQINSPTSRLEIKAWFPHNVEINSRSFHTIEEILESALEETSRIIANPDKETCISKVDNPAVNRIARIERSVHIIENTLSEMLGKKLVVKRGFDNTLWTHSTEWDQYKKEPIRIAPRSEDLLVQLLFMNKLRSIWKLKKEEHKHSVFDLIDFAQVYFVIEIDGVQFLIMEYIEGDSIVSSRTEEVMGYYGQIPEYEKAYGVDLTIYSQFKKLWTDFGLDIEGISSSYPNIVPYSYIESRIKKILEIDKGYLDIADRNMRIRPTGQIVLFDQNLTSFDDSYITRNAKLHDLAHRYIFEVSRANHLEQ